MPSSLLEHGAGLLRDLPAHAVLLAQAASTCALVGVIWMVQVVHYPLLLRVGPASFEAYHHGHLRRITLVVGPLMVLEAACALWVFCMQPQDVAPALAVAGLGLVLLVWLSTAFVQVPLHARLEQGFDERAIRRLVATNWVRTVLWTARAILVLASL